MQIVAALYVDLPRGPYAHIDGVDPWGTARDARTYNGPGPVVAHPPCGPWGRLHHLYRGNEHDCGPMAVAQVRTFGGALEHPAGSKLWEACGLPYPTRCAACDVPRWRCMCAPIPTDEFGGYTIELDQCEWGHVARKRTWIYLVGVPREALEAPPYPGRKPTHWISGFRNSGVGKHPKRADACPSGIKICSAQQRRRTPPEFAAYLVRLARSVRP
jgi:hypothetical protein